MIVISANSIEGKKITHYYGMVYGEAILGANIFKDFFASIRDIVGGRSAAYENELRKAREIAVNEMMHEAEIRGANAIIAVDVDYETLSSGSGSHMLMVSVNGTAIKYV